MVVLPAVCRRRSRAQQEAAFNILPLPLQGVIGITLDDFDDHLYARRDRAGSAGIPFDFALLRGCHQ
jgi:hypothetical protein